jgi:hypothetical protein
MKCHTNDNSTSSTQLPHKFSYIVAILGHKDFESPNMYSGKIAVPPGGGGLSNVIIIIIMLKMLLHSLGLVYTEDIFVIYF